MYTIPSLTDIAKQAMMERDFNIEFPKEVLNEVEVIESQKPPILATTFQDMRDQLWFSIDNEDSRDLDQLTFAEKTPDGRDIAYVAVADVDILVKPWSAIDKYAAHNTTSVYTPTMIFPMLPMQLSTDLTSLNPNVDRYSIVIKMEIAKDGKFNLLDIYPAVVRNHAKLVYNEVATWMANKDFTSYPGITISGFPEQLKYQDQLAQRIKEYRYRQGALSFGVIELQPVVVNGIPVDLAETVHNRAHTLIENFMIAANVSVTRYLMKENMPTFRRIVRTPNRWDRILIIAKDLGSQLPEYPDAKALREFLLKQKVADPEHYPDLSLAIIKLIGKGEYVVGFPGEPTEGHFDLAQRDYAHTTAPNRRFPDLIMQRLLKCCFAKKESPYKVEELVSLAQHCTQKEDDANKVDRRVRKSAAAMVLASQVGKQFGAIVTGASEKGTWVRLHKPPIEGKLVAGFQGLDVGDILNVKLTRVDIAKGFIDFIRI